MHWTWGMLLFVGFTAEIDLGELQTNLYSIILKHIKAWLCHRSYILWRIYDLCLYVKDKQYPWQVIGDSPCLNGSGQKYWWVPRHPCFLHPWSLGRDSTHFYMEVWSFETMNLDVCGRLHGFSHKIRDLVVAKQVVK